MAKDPDKREVVDKIASIAQQCATGGESSSAGTNGKQVEDARRALRDERRLTSKKLERAASV